MMVFQPMAARNRPIVNIRTYLFYFFLRNIERIVGVANAKGQKYECFWLAFTIPSRKKYFNLVRRSSIPSHKFYGILH